MTPELTTESGLVRASPLRRSAGAPWPVLLGYAAALFGLAQAGAALARGPGGVATFWPASGLAIGVLLCVPRRRWPAFLLAGVLPLAAFNLAAGQPAHLVATFAAANLVEPALGAWLRTRFARGSRTAVGTPPALLALVAGGTLAAALANGGSTLALLAPGEPFLPAWVRLWLGDVLGILVVAPLVKAFLRGRPVALGAARRAEAAALTATFAAAAWVTCFSRGVPSFGPALFVPLGVWASLRFGPRGATALGAALTVAVLGGTALGTGFFAEVPSPAGSALSAQAFAALAQVSLLALSGVAEARRLSAEALARSTRELRLVRAATDAAHDTLLCADADGRVVYANLAACRALGRGAPAEVTGRRIWELLGQGGAERWAAHLAELRERGPSTQEVKTRGPEGDAIPYEVVVTRIAFDGREYAVAAGRDLRERKQVEVASRLATVGTLAAGIAHEINNPLAALLTNLEFAAEELEAVRRAGGPAALDAVTPAIAESLEATRRARDIVHDLKVFSRGDDREDPDGADVARAVRSALSLSRHELRQHVRLEVDLAPVPRVRGSERRLGQVFLNLLVNAAQAVVGREGSHVIRVATRHEGDEVVAEVEDTGCGMSPEVLARAFDPFFTTKAAGVGTGLGLSICHGIVAAVGGRIEVASRPGKGSRFRVRLPVAASPAAAAP